MLGVEVDVDLLVGMGLWRSGGGLVKWRVRWWWMRGWRRGEVAHISGRLKVKVAIES
jgi:hypothetical protein